MRLPTAHCPLPTAHCPLPTVPGEPLRPPGLAEQVVGGLETVWKPFGEESVVEVQPGSPIIGRRCPWCRFPVRAGDRVIHCPCGRCGTWFHDDLFRRLTCWNDWNGARGTHFCPTTGARIPARRAAAEQAGDGG